MSKTTKITAYGLEWGSWTRDCRNGINRVTPTRGVHEKFGFDTINLLEKISSALSFIPNDSLKLLLKRIKKWIPKGRFALELAISITAGQTKCLGTPPVRIIHAGLTLALTANVEININGAKSNAKIMLLEHLTLEQASCRCPTKKTTKNIGFKLEQAENLLGAAQYLLIDSTIEETHNALILAQENPTHHGCLEVLAPSHANSTIQLT